MVTGHLRFIPETVPQIGKYLRKIREKAGLSQAEVARKAKVSPAMLCRLEKGKGNPTVGTVSRIIRAIRSLS